MISDKNIKYELTEFLKNAKLSTYEIKTFLSLLFSNTLTAREICEQTKVPNGRIYEVLEELKVKGMIEVQDSRPKKYRALAFNTAFRNLITFKDKERKRETSFLSNQAKKIETSLYNSDVFIKKETTKQFWSIAFGVNSIFSLYVKHSCELKDELLFTGFLNNATLKVIPHAKVLYDVIHKAVKKGVRVKYLWSFDYDNRPLTEEEKSNCGELYKKINNICEKLYDISPNMKRYESKYIYKSFPTYYDIFDQKRVLIKLQNPLRPSQIYACINVLDTELAEALRKKFLNTWEYEAIST